MSPPLCRKSVFLEMSAGTGSASARVVAAAAGVMIPLDFSAGLGGMGIAVKLLCQIQSIGGNLGIRLRALTNRLHFDLQHQADHQRHAAAYRQRR